MTIDLLNEMIQYIEEVEEQIDGEWGMCRSVSKIIADGDMPELYAKLVSIKNRQLDVNKHL